MKKIIFLLFAVSLNQLHAQKILVELQKSDSGNAKISVYQDESISTLLNARIDEIKSKQTINGFRIRIFSDHSQGGQKKALNTRSKFIAKFPHYNCDYKYDQPDNKLYVGNFRTKSEAQKALKEIKTAFPKAFIINDEIDLPDLE